MLLQAGAVACQVLGEAGEEARLCRRGIKPDMPCAECFGLTRGAVSWGRRETRQSCAGPGQDNPAARRVYFQAGVLAISGDGGGGGGGEAVQAQRQARHFEQRGRAPVARQHPAPQAIRGPCLRAHAYQNGSHLVARAAACTPGHARVWS